MPSYRRSSTADKRRAAAELERRKRQRATAEAQPVLPCAEWIERFVTIVDVQDDGDETVVPFTLWPAQVEALDLIQSGGTIQILKARQLGLTWLVLAYWLWRMVHEKHRRFFGFSLSQDDANELVDRVRGMFERLPDEAKRGFVSTTDNVKRFELSNGSQMRAFPQSPTAGSSHTATEVLLDEFAKMHYDAELEASAGATARDGGARVIYLSTGFGESNVFYNLWQNPAIPKLFIPWNERPSRDAAWYQREIGKASDESRFRREYPSNPDEAFSKVGLLTAFISDIALWDRLKEDLLPLTKRDILYLAADAGVRRDAFGLAGCSAHPTERGVVAVRYGKAWLPDERTGKVSTTLVEDEIIRLSRIATIKCLYYDPSQMEHMAQRLEQRGIKCEPFQQGSLRPVADQGLYTAIHDGKIVHDGNPQIREHLDNADASVDDDERKRRIVKRKKDGSTPNDLAVALSMSHHHARADADKLGTTPQAQVVARPAMSAAATTERVSRALPPKIGF